MGNAFFVGWSDSGNTLTDLLTLRGNAIAQNQTYTTVLSVILKRDVIAGRANKMKIKCPKCSHTSDRYDANPTIQLEEMKFTGSLLCMETLKETYKCFNCGNIWTHNYNKETGKG